MCNLSERILEEGIKKGEYNMMFRLVSEDKYSVENAAKELGLTVEDFCEEMGKAGYKVPAVYSDN